MFDNLFNNKKPSNKKDLELFNLNKQAMFLHLGNCVAQILLYYYQKNSKKFTAPYRLLVTEENYGIYNPNNRVINNAFNRENFSRLNLAENVKYSFPLAIMVAAFSFMSFLAHYCIINLGGRYYSWIENDKINYARWIEYGISSPTMMFTIATLSRVNEIYSLKSVLTATAITNAFGLISEVIKEDNPILSRIMFSLGFLPFRSSWGKVLNNFGKTIDYVSKKKNQSKSNFEKDYEKIYGTPTQEFKDAFEIPSFVKYTVYSLFILYFTFPANMYLQRFYLPDKKQKDKFLGIKYYKDPYYFGEKGFIYLSFLSKATLTWLLFSGTRRPNNNKWFENDSFFKQQDKRKNINEWWIIGGLGLLTIPVLKYVNKKALPPDVKVKKKSREEEYFLKYLKNKNVDDLSDDELKELNKLLNIIDKKKAIKN